MEIDKLKAYLRAFDKDWKSIYETYGEISTQEKLNYQDLAEIVGYEWLSEEEHIYAYKVLKSELAKHVGKDYATVWFLDGTAVMDEFRFCSPKCMRHGEAIIQYKFRKFQNNAYHAIREDFIERVTDDGRCTTLCFNCKAFLGYEYGSEDPISDDLAALLEHAHFSKYSGQEDYCWVCE